MKAIVITRSGDPDVLQLQELTEPKIGSDYQLKVRLKAAGVNPIDTKLRARGVFFPDALPAVLGCDGAGVVVDTGTAVSRFKPGDEVWFCNGGLGREQGNYAEYTLVDEAVARHKPARIDFATAAAAPLVLITAWEALYDRAALNKDKAALNQEKRVLIHAGAGGVGHVAIQLAKLAGASVCTTVSTPEKGEFVRTLGAEQVIYYRERDFVEAVRDWTGGAGADVVLDTVGGELFSQSIPAVAHYGDLVTLLDPGSDLSWKQARNRNLRIGFELMLTPMLEDLPQARAHQGEILDQCSQWIEAGKLAIQVSRTYPLEQAAVAHTDLETGHVQGKLVLTMD